MSQSQPFLPYGRQTIDDDDVDAVARALRGEFLTTGPLVEHYEAAFAGAVGCREAVSCNNGTAALHLACAALGVGPGDEVVVPTITFLATANAVRMAGADVVFADVDPYSGLMTAQTLEVALQRSRGRVKAAIPVHLNGQLCAMQQLSELAQANRVLLIEDACHALGARGAVFAQQSSVACFSTHPVKNIATGEGGVIATEDVGLAARMRTMRNHGMIRDPARFLDTRWADASGRQNPWYYEMHEIGWNYRLPDILCALGISQLNKLDSFIARREAIAAAYDSAVSALRPAVLSCARANEPHGWHLYVVRIDFERIGVTRAQVMEKLRSANIGSQVHYIPVHRQPYYLNLYGQNHLPGAEDYYSQCLSLPLYPSMSDEDVQRVVSALSLAITSTAAVAH